MLLAIGALGVDLYPVYVRGKAYLMFLDGKAAASEFQKFIDHYGLVANFHWGRRPPWTGSRLRPRRRSRSGRPR